MTDAPQGRDGSPSVAVLAVQVDRLRREVDSLAAKVGGLARTQHAHAAVLGDVAELRQQVEQILDILGEENGASPAEWFWLRMGEQAREEKLGELFDWVETVLREQYPGYLADQIKPCWPNHPEARWELAWLYQQWTLTYLAKRPAPRDAAEWHDRWSPGVLGRLREVMRLCDTACQRQHSREAADDPGRKVPL